MPIHVFCITGSIGAGKTTVLVSLEALFADNAKYVFIKENVEKWQFYLQRFYKEPEKHLINLQDLIINHYCEITLLLEKALDNGDDTIFIIERSPWDVENVFIPCNEDKSVNNEYYKMLSSRAKYYREYWESNFDITYFYLDVDVNTCMERIKMRSRTGETEIKQQYMQQIEEKYAALLDRDNTIRMASINDKRPYDIAIEISNQISNKIKIN